MVVFSLRSRDVERQSLELTDHPSYSVHELRCQRETLSQGGARDTVEWELGLAAVPEDLLSVMVLGRAKENLPKISLKRYVLSACHL